MKKAAILSFAAFYLLLSTGMYVCLLHCAAADLLKPQTVDCCRDMGNMPTAKQDSRHKKENKACNDCDKHGNYIVKENLKPSFNFEVAKLAAIDLPSIPDTYTTNNNEIRRVEMRGYNTAPPPLSGRSYLIQIRTLLI